METKKQKYDVAAYIWPAYTGDEPRTRMFWPDGIGEWQSVKSAEKKFPEHNWPRKPLWGYVNEADPKVMEMQIDQASEHGVNVFIYDWYWYDRRPFLEQCLNDGFLKASNNSKVKFYLMWANHDVCNIWDKRISNLPENLIWDGSVDRKEFEIIAKRMIEKYFSHPSYYKIDSKPVIMIYDTANLIRGLGGVKASRDALEWFRKETENSGFPGLHLQMTAWGKINYNLSGVDGGAVATTSEIVKHLGFDSISHYQFVHFTNIDRDYNEIMEDVIKEWDYMNKNFDIPYFPHISVGWDNNPRFNDFKPGIIKNNTPENIEKAFKMAKEYIDSRPFQTPLLTINSWNEWTESSYLQPDSLNGYGYLKALKKVFGCK